MRYTEGISQILRLGMLEGDDTLAAEDLRNSCNPIHTIEFFQSQDKMTKDSQ